MPGKSAVVFDINEIPADAKLKRKSSWKIEDLLPEQRGRARSADLCAIKDGNTVTILAPVGNVVDAAEAVISALKG